MLRRFRIRAHLHLREDLTCRAIRKGTSLPTSSSPLPLSFRAGFSPEESAFSVFSTGFFRHLSQALIQTFFELNHEQ